MNAGQRNSKLGKTVSGADFVRQRIRNVRGQVRKSGRDDTAELPAGDTADFFVDRHKPADIERGIFVVLLIEQFKLGVEENKLRFITVVIDAPEKNDFTTSMKVARLKV